MDIESGVGAIASNAGDDFHLIWACRMLLELLRYDTDLSAISVEGPAWKDSIEIADDKKLFSIDLAEYYGGCDFEHASYVIFSQLKYSSYQMDTPWTTANLCSSSNKAKNNSIIRRLADTFHKYNSTYLLADRKLKLKLVSNRSLSSEINTYLSEAREVLSSKKCNRTTDLLKYLSPECRVEIDKMYDTSSLGSYEFIKFFNSLDFEDCGTEIRSILKVEISKVLGYWTVGDIRNRYNNLIMHLREMMLPESIHGHPMNRDYILAALGTTSQQMFPAPSQIQPLSYSYVERAISGELAKEILNNNTATICVHATAGIGKTTLVNNLQIYLPEESVVVFYDCYGGGSFLLPSERRHLPEVAITQICNSLAIECGTGWIISRSHKEYELLRFLRERLKSAAEYIKKLNPNAVVVLVIDACDNSVIAAQTYNDVCFVDSLLKEHLPDGVACVVTSRTERCSSIEFPENTVFFPVPSFDLEESSLHLHTKFPYATDTECMEFHNLTDKTPRLQAYALSSATVVEEALNLLRPNGKTIESLFNGFINTIREQYKSSLDVETLFSALTNLPRPIPVKIIQELFGVTHDVLVSMSVECQRGFYISDGYIYFKDEDFETYLRNKFEANTAAMQAIADYMYENRALNAYCARYVHLFLNKVNRFNDMIHISLDEQLNLPVLGLSQSNQTLLQRIKATLKRPEMLVDSNKLVSCKLIYKMIDLTANDDALDELLRGAPDEALLYCDEISLYSIFDTKGGNFSELSNAALVFSKMPACAEKAVSYLKSYSAAVSVYYDKQDSERGHHDSPQTGDIISIVESLLILGEKEQAIDWICSWSPKKYQSTILYGLIKKLNRYGYHDICKSILDVKWSSPNKLAVVSAFIASGL